MRRAAALCARPRPILLALVSRCITIVAILCGVIFMAMPLAIVGSNFSTVWEQKQNLRIINEVQTHFLNQARRQP